MGVLKQVTEYPVSVKIQGRKKEMSKRKKGGGGEEEMGGAEKL